MIHYSNDSNQGTFRVEVIADNSGKFCGNGMTFDTSEEARDYAVDLHWRWTAVKSWRVMERVMPVDGAIETTEGGWQVKEVKS